MARGLKEEPVDYDKFYAQVNASRTARLKLPVLPKLTKRVEEDWDGKVATWFHENWDNAVCIEVKMKGGTVLLHQKSALQKAESEGWKQKLRDDGSRQPFDYIVIPKKHAPDAFIVWVDPKKRLATVKTPVKNITQFEFKL